MIIFLIKRQLCTRISSRIKTWKQFQWSGTISDCRFWTWIP